MTRLLMVRVLGKEFAVVASLFTVFVAAFVINTRGCVMKGATFSDQLAPTSHLPLTLLVQRFVPVAVLTIRHCENSVVPLAVAVRNMPGVIGAGQLIVKLPPASVAMLVDVSS